MIVYICLILISISGIIIVKSINNLRIYVNNLRIYVKKFHSDLIKTLQEVHDMKQEFSKINKSKYDKVINSLKENKKVTFKDAIKFYIEERK